jgi:hypothetical protein
MRRCAYHRRTTLSTLERVVSNSLHHVRRNDLWLRYMSMAPQHASCFLTPHEAHKGEVNGSADGADRQPPHGGGRRNEVTGEGCEMSPENKGRGRDGADGGGKTQRSESVGIIFKDPVHSRTRVAIVGGGIGGWRRRWRWQGAGSK